MLRLVVAIVLLLVLLARANGCSATRSSGSSPTSSAGYQAIPKWIVDVLAIGGRILAVAVLVFGLLFTILRSGWRMLVTVLVAAALGVALVLLAERHRGRRRRRPVTDAHRRASDPPPIRGSRRSGASAPSSPP